MLELAYQIIMRAALGLVALIPGIIIYFNIQKRKGKFVSFPRIFGYFVFGYYLMGVLTVTGIETIKEFNPRFELVPFADFIPSLTQSILNIILFVPLGFLLPILFIHTKKFQKTVLTGFFFSLSIECIQVFGFGLTDINDLITNTLGTIIGFGLWKVFDLVVKPHTKTECQKDSKPELFFLIIYAWIVMLTIQPFLVEFVGKQLNLV